MPLSGSIRRALIERREVEKQDYIAYVTAFWMKMLQRWNRVIFADTKKRIERAVAIFL